MKKVAERIIYNDKFTDGIIGPSVEMLGPVADGGTIVFKTTPDAGGL